MMSCEEIYEISTLCEENELFSKYINKFREENERMFAKLTHELGNPITLISSTAQLIESRNPEVHDIRYWNQLRNDIESLSELFLSFSKYRNCNRIEYEETDIVGLVCEVAESFQAAAAKKNVSIIMERPVLNCELLSYACDPVKIRQALVNLVKNALEAADGGEKIWIRICGKEEMEADEDSYLKIEIIDSGRLIAEEELKHIFEPGVSSKGKNRGMGLPIAYRIVESHKGIIKVSSQVKNGERRTVFSIYLPV